MLVRSDMMRLMDRSDVGDRRSFDWAAMSAAQGHRLSRLVMKVLWGIVGIMST